MRGAVKNVAIDNVVVERFPVVRGGAAIHRQWFPF